MKLDLRAQVNQAAEALFARKLASGEISFRLVSSNDPTVNWKLAETLEIELSDEDRALSRKNGDDLERSLFEKVFARDWRIRGSSRWRHYSRRSRGRY